MHLQHAHQQVCSGQFHHHVYQTLWCPLEIHLCGWFRDWGRPLLQLHRMVQSSVLYLPCKHFGGWSGVHTNFIFLQEIRGGEGGDKRWSFCSSEISNTLGPLYTSLELAIVGSLVLGFDKFSFTAQTIESLTSSQAPNTRRKCKVAMLKVRYQGAITKQRRTHGMPKKCLKAHWLRTQYTRARTLNIST